MANFESIVRTNYFRVTDERKYEEILSGLCAEDTIHDFTKTGKDGRVYHGFGCYGTITYFPDDDNDSYGDIEDFFEEIRKILPEDEAFIFMHIGNEKLRYVGGEVWVITKNKGIEFMNTGDWAYNKAREMLGDPNFTTKIDY